MRAGRAGKAAADAAVSYAGGGMSTANAKSAGSGRRHPDRNKDPQAGTSVSILERQSGAAAAAAGEAPAKAAETVTATAAWEPNRPRRGSRTGPILDWPRHGSSAAAGSEGEAGRLGRSLVCGAQVGSLTPMPLLPPLPLALPPPEPWTFAPVRAPLEAAVAVPVRDAVVRTAGGRMGRAERSGRDLPPSRFGGRLGPVAGARRGRRASSARGACCPTPG